MVTEAEESGHARMQTGQLFDIDEVPPAKQQAIAELDAWMSALRVREQNETLRKAAQYSSVDLVVLGQTMGTLLGVPVADERTAMQLGCAFYAMGKIARIIGAISNGGSPQGDSWYDLHIYGIMGLKVWETGTWA